MKTSDTLNYQAVYTRAQLKQMFGIVDATINTGVFQPKGHHSVWLFVTQRKTADRTQYHDLLEGDRLVWDGQTSGRSDRLIIEHEQRGLELLLFYRQHKYQHPGAGFRYEGRFKYISHTGQHPAQFVLQRDELEAIIEADLKAMAHEELFEEGGTHKRLSRYYERNLQLRLEAIRLHGTACMVCGFSFEKAYGLHGKDFIEVHHLVPVSSFTESHLVNPATDMVVVCANCHRMLHRKLDKPLSVAELKQMYKQNKR